MYAPEKKVSDDKLTVTPLDAWTVPLGGQEIALQQVDFAVGGMSLLRTRIREGRRFTIFDVDPATASNGPPCSICDVPLGPDFSMTK